MDDAGIGPLPHFLGQDRGSIRFGITRMDDQRQARFPASGDVRAKARLLPRAVAMVVIIVEAAFADTHHARVLRAFDQLGGIDMRMRVRLMRVDAHRRPDVRLALGGGDDRIPFAFARGDVEHRGDAAFPRPRQDRRLILGQPLVIQVAMAVGEHQASASAGTSRRGKAGVGGDRGTPCPARRAYQPSSSIAA